MIVREGIPGAAIWRVVLTYGAPLSLRKVGSPAPPRLGAFPLIDQSLALGGRLARNHHAWTVPSAHVSVTAAAGKRVTRSTSKVSERREVPISMVMSTTPTSTVNTLSMNTA